MIVFIEKACLLSIIALAIFFRIICDYSQGILTVGSMRKWTFLHIEKGGKNHKTTSEFSTTFAITSSICIYSNCTYSHGLGTPKVHI